MPVIPHTFSLPGLAAGAKLLYFGATGTLPARLAAEARSLKIEHVSPELVVPQEICRCTSPGRLAGRPRTRKPDAGFLLEGFPATLLHARVFDEWLDARDEVLVGCLCVGPRPPTVKPATVEHYRTLGLLLEFELAARAPV